MSNLSAIDYAKDWCIRTINEPDNCISGATFATSALQKGTSPSDIVGQCSNWGVADIQPGDPSNAATEGFRYGCYLTTVFNGDQSNMCTVNLQSQDNSTTTSVPFVCQNTCKNIYSSGDSLTACMSSANSAMATKVDSQGACTSGVQSCVQMLSQSTPTSVPSAFGCTLGQLQGEMLYNIQSQQKSWGQTPLSCQSYSPSTPAPPGLPLLSTPAPALMCSPRKARDYFISTPDNNLRP